MKSSREILNDVLQDAQKKHLLIGEDHTHHASKDLILENFDLLAASGRNIIIILEHISVEKNELLRMIGQILKNELDPKMEKIIDETIRKNFSTMYCSTKGGEKFLEVIKKSLKSGFTVVGAENHFTGYTSNFTGFYCNRIADGNKAFTAEIKNCLQKSNSFIILLAGAKHISDYKAESLLGTPVIQGVKTLIDHHNDTVSWFAKDSVSIEEESVLYNQPVSYLGSNLNFDVITNRTPPPETPFEDKVSASTSTNTSEPITFFFRKPENRAETINLLSGEDKDIGLFKS
jgi:hypothetical protein